MTNGVFQGAYNNQQNQIKIKSLKTEDEHVFEHASNIRKTTTAVFSAQTC